MPPHWTPSPARALRIALFYALVGGLWILCSGWVLHRLVVDDVWEARLEVYKGWFFVAATAGLLWLSLDRYFRQLRQATQRLEESEQRSRFALEGTGQGAWDWNPQTNEVHYSARWKTMLGYEPQELDDTHSEWETRLHGDDCARALAELKRHLDGQTPAYRSEHRLRCKDGSYKWVLDQGKVMRHTSAGAPLRVLGTVSDITERKHAEAALQESEARYREVVQSANSVILRIDGEGKVLFINEFAQRFFGYRAEELVGGKVVGTIIPPTDSLGTDLRGLPIEIAAKPDQYTTHENENLRRDGSRVWMSWTNRPFRDDAGRVREVLCIGHDVTRRKQAELALQESEERLRFALEAAHMGTFGWEMASGRLTWSRQHERLWGLAPGQFGGDYEGFAQGIHPEDREGVRGELQRCLATRSPFNCEFRVVWPDGSVHWIAGAGKYTLGPDGSPVRMYGIAREVTERKLAEQTKSLSVEVLQILNDPQPLRESARRILAAIKRETGLEAVGIRLRQGEDFPYLGADGFTQEFLDAENSLAVRTGGNEFCRDEQGRVLLECTCGLVLSGKTDPANPLYTPSGSAWTNDARPFLKVPAQEDARLHPRNRCIHEGYQSVALIPIRVKEQIVGLLQLNDARQNCFTAEMIRFFEGIASAFGVALLREQEAEALRTSEANLQSLFDAIPESVFLMDTEGRLLAANGTFAARMGRRVEDCVGANVFEFLPPEVKERRRAWVAEVVRSGRPLVREDERSGYWLRHSLNPVLDASGKVERIVSFAVDLTERRREDAVRQQWADAFEHCAHGIALGDPATNRILACNPAFASMLAGRREEIVGAQILSVYSPADHERIRACIAAADRAGQVRYEAHMIRPDGSVFPVQMDVVSVRDAGGRTIYRVATAQDITERRRAEEALRQSEARYRLVAENGSDVIWLYDLAEDHFSYVSPSVERLRGFTVEEVLAQKMEAALTPEAYGVVRDQLPARLAAFAAGDESVRVQSHEVYQTCKHRPAIPTEVVTTLITDDHGRVTHIQGITRDITERQRTEAEREQLRQRQDLALSAARMGWWHYDPQTRMASYDARFGEIFEVAGTASPNAEILKRLHPEDLPRVWAAVEAALDPREPRPFAIEYRILVKDGAHRWVRAYGLAEFAGEGVARRAVSFVGTVADITDARNAEAQLRDNLLFRREAETLARIGAWKVNPRTDFLYWTEGIYEIIEAPSDYRPGLEKGLGFYDAESIPVIKEALRGALEDGMPFLVEARLTTAKGKRLWVEVRGCGRTGEGEETFLMGTLQDVTERKLAEVAARETGERLRLAMEAANLGTWDRDLGTGELRWSVQEERLMGYQPGSFPGRIEAYTDLLHPDSRAAFETAHERVHTGDGILEVELHFRLRDGRERWGYLCGRRIDDPEGRPARIIGVDLDITERKRSEAELLKHRQLLEETGRIAKVGGWEFDPHTGLGSWTPEVARIHDLSPETPTCVERGLSFYDETSRPSIEQALREVVEQARPYDLELRILTAKGVAKWVRTIGYPVVSDGKVVMVRGALQDITEQHATAEALRRSERLQRTILDNIPDPAWLKDRQGRFMAVNQAWCRVVGLSPEEAVGRLDSTIFPAALAEELDRADREVLASGVARHYEEAVRDAQGYTRIYDTYKAPVQDERGGSSGTIGIARDITERKRIEAALKASEEKFRQLVENTYDIIYSLGPAGELRYVSPAWKRMLGYEMAEAEGVPFTAFVHPDDQAACFAFLQAVAEARPPQGGVEYRVRRKDGAWRWHVSNVNPVRDAAGAVAHFDGVAHDITDQKLAEREIRRQTGLINALLDSIPDLIFFKNLEGAYLGCNPAFASFVGRSREEILGKTDHDLFAREIAESFRQYDDEMLRERQSRHNEEWVDYPGGRRVLLDTLKTPYWGPDHTLLGVLGISRDITARKLAENALRDREQQLQIFVEHSPAAIAMLDCEMRYMVVSRRWMADYRLGNQVMAGRSHYEVFPEMPERWREIHQRCLAGAVEKCEADPFPRADGLLDWVRWEIRPWRAGGGEIGGIIIFSELISDQVQARAALERSELEFRAMFEMASIGMGQTDPVAGRWLRVNQKLCEITGYPAAEMVDLEVQQITHPEDRPEDEAQLQRLLGGEVPSYQREKRYVRKDGRVVWVRVNVTVIRETDGRPLRTMATIEDITERRRADERLARDRQRTGFLLEFHQRAPQMADRELYDHVLERAVRLTGSRVGFFHQVSDDQNTIILTTWNQEALKSCTAAFDTHYPLREAGNWVDCVRQQRPVVYNDYAHSPNQRGLPAGHAPVQRFMSIPVIRDGKVRIIFGVGNKATDYDGEDVEQLQVVANELHKIMIQRTAERQLRQLSWAVEQSPVSVVITSLDGTIEYVNPKFSEVSGYAAEEVIGQNPRVLKSGETPPGQYQQLWEAILAGREWHGEFHNRRKNGGLYWELASVSPITDERGNITHFVALKEDISERKRLEAFRQALLILGRLLNGTREPVEAGRALLQTADQLWHWDAATLDLLTPDQQAVLPVLRVDQIGGERRELPEATPSLALTPRMRQVMQDGAKLIDQGADDPAAGGALAFGDVSRPSATVMYVPIRREHDTVGLLSIHSYTPRAYSPEDLYTLQALADYCGGALDRIRSEHGLRTSEERYRSLVETAFDWVWEVDAEGRYTYASPKVEELLGYRPEEVLGQTPFDLMPPEEAERIGAVFREYSAARRLIVAIENVCRHKDGSLVVLETSGAPVLDQEGRLLGYRGMDRDITQRKRAEAALKASEERFRTLVESAPSGIFVQTQGRFAYLNRTAMKYFGLPSPEPLLGQPVLERFVAEARDHVLERIRRLNEERQPAPPAEEKCLRLDGTTFEAEVTAVPFSYDGNPGALVFFQDVTQRKHLEAQLRQAQKLEAIGQLAGGVAHDFNNILATILMHLSLLAQDKALGASQRADLEELVKEAKRGSALTRQLLLFSRRQAMQPAVLDLNVLLDNLLKMLRRLLGEHIELGFRESADPMWIEADAGMMEQVVMNLCVNARDAMPAGGRLTLSTALIAVDERHASQRAGARAGSLVCLAVQDTGQGMDEATQLRIFEPFFTTKEVGKGTGLGLATVHGIVQQHNGWVEVDSQVGQGTTFRVYLPPAKKPQEVIAREKAEAALPGGKETLLVVEDERLLRLAVAGFLRHRGYRVIEAQNGEEALRQWEQHGQDIALVVSDMVMPGGIDGLELARRLRTQKPGLGVVITSGYSINLPVQAGTLAEGIVYLPKPCDPAELAKTIRTLLDGRPPA